MKTILIASVLLASACSAQITAVVNAASNLPMLGPGILATIYGKGMTPAGCSASATSLPLPYTLCGVFVGAQLESFSPLVLQLLYVSPTQINVYMSDVPGHLEVQWRSGNTGYGAVFDIEEAIPSPGIFVAESDCTLFDSSYPIKLGGCPPSDQVLRGAVTDLSGALISQDNPATVNQYLTLWGTGINHYKGLSLFKPPPLQIGSAMVAMPMSDQQVNVPFSGPSPQYPGLDQVNFLIDAGSNFPCGQDTKLEADLGFLIGFKQQTNRVKLPIVVKASQVPCTK